MTTMQIDRATVEQALEALKFCTPKPRPTDDDYAEQGWKEHNAAITTLRAALAQQDKPVQDEPVHDRHGACPTHCCPIHGCKYMHDDCPVVSGAVKPVYPRNNGCESCAEDALAQQAEPVQEPAKPVAQQAKPLTGLDMFLDPADGLKPKPYKPRAEPVLQTRKDGHYSVAYRCKCGHEQNVTEIVQGGRTYAGSGANWCDGCGDGPPVRVDAMQQQAEPVQDQRCRAKPRSDGDFVCDCKIGDCPGRSAALAQQAEPVEQLAELQAMLRAEVDRLIAAGIQPQRKPLPKHDQHCVDVPGYGLTAVRLVRAVELAHGIKEN